MRGKSRSPRGPPQPTLGTMILHRGAGDTGDLSALSPWANELAQTFVSLASDIALVVDAAGVIRNVAQRGGEPMAPGASSWVGQAWADTVTGDTRRKIDLLMQEVASTGLARRREVNHPSSGGNDIPVAYTAIRLGLDGPVLAVGRDLRAVAAIQQRFLDTQQELERGYWKGRQAESRERQLVQVASDAVLVVDAASLTIVAANAAAAGTFGTPPAALRGQDVAALFDAHSRGPIDELMVAARGSGRPLEIRVRLAAQLAATTVSATPFRSGAEQRLLVRVRAVTERSDVAARRGAAAATREAVGVTDSTGRVLSCSPAFAALAGLQREDQVLGRLVSDWLGDVPSALAALLADVRRDGIVECEHFAWRGPGSADVGLSATLLTEGDQECIGLVVRPVVVALPEDAAFQRMLASALSLLELRIGVVPLSQMVREAAKTTERHIIEAALERSSGDTTAAAAMLGLSRDALQRRRRRARATPQGSGQP